MVYLSLSASISSFNPFGLNAFALCNILLELLSFKKLSWTSVFPPCSYQSLVVFWLNFYTMKFSRFCWPGPCPKWQLIYLTTLSLLCQELFLNFFPLSVASFLRCLSLRQLDYCIILLSLLSIGLGIFFKFQQREKLSIKVSFYMEGDFGLRKSNPKDNQLQILIFHLNALRLEFPV